MIVKVVLVAVALGVISDGSLVARQDAKPQQPAPPAQADTLLLTQSTPHLIVWAVKASRGADFEALWSAIQATVAKSDRPEVKEFGASITNIYKVAAVPGAPPEAPVFYVFQLDKPSTTQSYNPGKVVYEFLYIQKDGKESGIPRAEADAIFEKAGKNMQEMFVNILVWPLTKIGS
jgi:hypothetical protein